MVGQLLLVRLPRVGECKLSKKGVVGRAKRRVPLVFNVLQFEFSPLPR